MQEEDIIDIVSLPPLPGIRLMYGTFILQRAATGTMPIIAEGDCTECGTYLAESDAMMTITDASSEIWIQCHNCGEKHTLHKLWDQSIN